MYQIYKEHEDKEFIVGTELTKKEYISWKRAALREINLEVAAVA